MPVFFSYEKEEFKIFDEQLVSNWIILVTGKENKKLGNLTYQFISDNEILKINSDFLNHHYYTDIITFDYNLVNIINGDIFISFDTVCLNAKIFNVSTLNELYRVIIHGVIHLCGYNDSTENEKFVMRNLEDKYLAYLEKL